MESSSLVGLAHPMPAPLLTITIPGEMRGKGRPRFARMGSFVRAYTDAATISAENWIKACAVDQARLAYPLDAALWLDVAIGVAIPRSWSKKRQAEAATGRAAPTGKPDLDNCIKLIADACNGVLWRDDKQIVRVLAAKRYSLAPATVLTVRIAP